MIAAFGVSGVPELNKNFVMLKLKLNAASVKGARAGGKIFQDGWISQITQQGWTVGHRKLDPRSIPPHQYIESIVVGEPRIVPGLIAIEVTTDIENRPGQGHNYPFYQEFGWLDKKSKKQMPARPTMTPAYEAKKAEAEAAIAGAIIDFTRWGIPSHWTNVRDQVLKLKGISDIAYE